MVEVMGLSLPLEVEDNSLEALTPEGVSIGLPIRLKRLEPTKSLSYLI